VAICLLMMQWTDENTYVVDQRHEHDDGEKNGCGGDAHGDDGAHGDDRRHLRRSVMSATRHGYAHILHHDGHDRGCSPAAGTKSRETQEEPQASAHAAIVVA